MIGQVYSCTANNIICVHTYESYSDWWSTDGRQAFYHQRKPRSPYPDYKNIGTILMGLI